MFGPQPFPAPVPVPEQLEAQAAPSHGVEGREEAQPVVDLVPDGPGVLALRPEPLQAVDLGMGIAGFGALLELPNLGSQVRHSMAQQSAHIDKAGRRIRRVELHHHIQRMAGAREPRLGAVIARRVLNRLVDPGAALAPRPGVAARDSAGPPADAY
jgi:hypothetical protein